ncbi:EAL domain-containing protein [Methylomicrobium sp. Wu6]|uniref:EAL domain-containing protein n=1 Tax=Methylomicrobium sp. Wu6 TaxID=3107928 RepID=UPI002DD651A7|nr:EAL domain-containing protein [Methylomicrobium sp. Wu6]MEC4747749.1 EAL domain-containing protein [Methylomicrobium sp. Wu6]
MEKNTQCFLSLVWKAILSVSFATFLASGAIVLFGQFTLNKNYEQERSRLHHAYSQAFQAILEQVKSDRIDISWLIPGLLESTMGPDKALDAIKKTIDRNWSQIELESQIASVFLFTKDARRLGNWGDAGYQKQFDQWVRLAAKNETSYDYIGCEDRCIHFRTTPFLHNGDFLGIFIFGIDLADSVLKLKKVIGLDAGILTKHPPSANSSILRIEPWSMNVIAMTEFNKNSALLTEVSKRHPEDLPQGSLIIEVGGKTYDLISLPFEGSDSTRLLIIEDVSSSLNSVKQATALYALSGLLSLLLSGGVLLFLLIGPTRRLKSLVNVFPLIAKKQYHAVAKHIRPSKRAWVKDEIDVLESASHALICTLQELDDQVNQRTQALSNQAKELLIEKNFIDNMLNTAQVIILTIDKTGMIRTVNKFTEQLTGYSASDLVGKLFSELFFTPETSELIRASNGVFERTQTKSLQFECPIFAVDGSELYLSWYLSPLFIEELGVESTDETLVVGLDLTERKKSENRLTWLAEHDPLTSLYNRRKFEKELEHAISLAIRQDHKSAIVFFDIDQFKYINDSSGHQVGDELLVKVAEKLRHITRQADIIARFGGDEFILLASNVDQKQAEDLAQKLCSEMATVVIGIDSEQHRVSVSAGLLMFPEGNCSAHDLLASVDIAMYRAKEEGRGGWRLASHDDINRKQIKSRVTWKARIEKALEENRFVLYYQPIMRIADRTIVHYECLLRMVGEGGEISPPAKFIEVAEQTGLIYQIDLRVIELAFRTQAELLRQGCNIKMSINLSAEMLSNPDAFTVISRFLQQYHLDAEHFIFEVTETQAVTRLQAAHDLILQIESIGGSFALDDFGVGFSSMSYLKQLPVNYLKIDGSFVKNIVHSREDQLFVNAINSVGQGMGIKTIAEFVENQDILEVLAGIGIDYAQGYGIGKPMPHPEFHWEKIKVAS